MFEKKLSRFFFLSPSFFAMISGAGIGITTGILINFIKEKLIENPIGIITILLFFISSLSFVSISLKLEYFKDELERKERRPTREDMWDLIKDWQVYLWSLFWFGVVCFELGIIFIFYLYMN